VYITGNFKKYLNRDKYIDKENIVFLGFLPEEEYLSYLFGCDATIVLTTMPMTLNCGSYESVVAGKIQLVADSPVIRSYFRYGCVYISSFSPAELRSAVTEAHRMTMEK